MARRTIRVYTDYRSPYAYLADADIRALEDKHDVTLDWYPYILPIEQYLGTEDNRTGHQWRRIKYAYRDARRLAEEQGLNDSHFDAITEILAVTLADFGYRSELVRRVVARVAELREEVLG